MHAFLRKLFPTGNVLCRVGLTFLCVQSLSASEPVPGQRMQIERQRGPASEIGAVAVGRPTPLLRLNYVSATWSDVLTDLAKKTDSQLIAQKVPDGRFSRRDFTEHSREEAVKILNRELEKKGFRLLEQDRYLIVIELEQTRTQYNRPAYSRETGQSPMTSSEYPIADNAPNARRFTQIIPPSRSSNQPDRGVIQQTSHREEIPLLEDPPPQPQRSVNLTVAPKHSSIEIARFLHQSFGADSKLLDAGPAGLPAFQVRATHRGSKQKEVQFAVGIDTAQNRLVIEAPENTARELESAIRMMDHAIEAEVEAFRLVPTDRDVKVLARNLQPAIARLLSVNNQQPATTDPSAPGTPDVPLNPADPLLPGIPGALAPNLRSDVDIYAVPELGALIIRGSAKDVEAVLAVMREIDKLSQGTTPSVQLLLLKHVDSTQLSTLLGTVYTDLIGRRSTTTVTPGQTSVAQRGTVTFVPITKPNSLLIIAPETDMDAIIELAEALDQPVDPQTEYEVFSLKSAIASQTVTLLTDFFADRTSLGGSIAAFADVRTNSVIVRARPRDLEEAASLIRKIDRDQSGAVSELKIVPLKYAIATEIADVLNEAIRAMFLPPGQSSQTQGVAQNINATGDSAQAIQEIKSLAIEFLATTPEGEEMLRSGILADVRITADARINSLLVTAPTKSMTLLIALIRQLDQLPSSIAEVKVFTLQNSDATQAAELLTTLFAPTTTAAQGQTGATAQGIQISGATDVSNQLVPVRFSVDIRTNTVVAVGGADALRVVEMLLLRLDEDEIRQRKTTVIRLKNSPADAVALTISNFLTRQQQLAQIQPELVSNIEYLEREVVVEAELNTNSLLLSATPRYYEQILQMIRRLDSSPPQVIIQALLVEVQLENTDEFGIELGLQDSILFSRGVPTPGFLFNTPTLGNNTTVPGSDIIGAQSLSNLGMGRNNSDLGFGGLVLSASSENVSVLIRALAARRNVQVLSRPQIRTLDNVQAQIQVGQQVPVVNGVTVGQLGQTNPNVAQQPTGIILTVRPRINPDGTIVMETTAEKSQLSDVGVPIFVDTNGTVIESPIIDITNAQSTVSVPNGHTIVMGGMITRSDSTIERKVPWLGDVPLLGRAFRYDTSQSRRSELLIFLTPRVILNDADSEFIKQVELERLHAVESDLEEIHGPIYSVPPETFDPARLKDFQGDYFPTDDDFSLAPRVSPYGQQPVPVPVPDSGDIIPMSYTVPANNPSRPVQPAARIETPPKRSLWPFGKK